MARLFLSDLTLRHFRSHAGVRLQSDGGPIAIHGPNGVGKTNILEAVSLFSPGRGLRRAGAEEMVRRPDGPGWKLSGVLQGFEQTHEIDIWFEPGSGRQLRIDGKPASQVALGRVARMLWLIPAMDRLWIEGAEGRRRFLDRMTLSFEPGHAQAALDYDKAMRERNRLIREERRDAAWFEALEAQMARAGAVMAANRRAALAQLVAAQAAASGAFPTAELSLLHPEGEMPETEEALSTALREGRARDMAAGRALVGPHRVDLLGVYAAKNVPARDCSTGEQKALLISLILANARALTGMIGAPPILLLDEVAAHLDGARRAALYDEIVGLGAQAWMTGTGRALFDGLEGRAQFLHVTETQGLSQVAAG